MFLFVRRPETSNDPWPADPTAGRLDDDLLYAHLRWPVVALTSGIAALALPAVGLAVTASLLTILSAPIQAVRWTEWAVAFLLYCGCSGAIAGLLAMWSHRTGHWREVTGGLLLWPASFPPSYAFVLTFMAIADSQPNPVLKQPIPASWSEATLRAILVSACLATLWFATWRPLNARLMRKVGKVDHRDVTAGLLRAYFHRRWFSLTRGRSASVRGRQANPASPVDHNLRCGD